MKFFCFTNNLIYAKALDKCNFVDTIFVDLEIIGKIKRQGHTNGLISRHKKSDISKMRLVLNQKKLGVRINPIHENSLKEIDEVIKRGADVLMLPMFKTVAEVDLLLKYVGNRCEVDLLFETKEALNSINKFPISCTRKIHIGINDLSLQLNLPHLFYCFFDNNLEKGVNYLQSINKEFGIGGVGAINSKPINPELILNANNFFKSTRLILSRSFLKEINKNNQAQADISAKNNVEMINNLNNKVLSLSLDERNKLMKKFKLQLDSLYKKNICI